MFVHLQININVITYLIQNSYVNATIYMLKYFTDRSKKSKHLDGK